MGQSAIEWCDHSIAAVEGCSPASPGCDHCYAARYRGTRGKHLACALGRTDDEPPRAGKNGELVSIGKTRSGDTRYVYNGRVALNHDKLVAALTVPKNGGYRYPKKTVLDAEGNPREVADRSKPKEPVGNRVFWNFQSDTFHKRLTFEEILAQFAVMAARDDLRFFVLTKRPEYALDIFAKVAGFSPEWREPRAALIRAYKAVTGADIGIAFGMEWPLPNVAIGVSAEDQKRWDERVRILRDIDAAMKFVSVEPMIGPVVATAEQLANLAQVIIGAESGHGARIPEISWAQNLAAQVLDAQEWKRPQAPWAQEYEDTTYGPSQLVSGPALFLKQWPVCEVCYGRGGDEPGRDADKCWSCDGGQVGKLRKGCPKLWIPGHGADSWQQSPVGWVK